jgi:ABC-2 type transport system ATP-binding protein
MNMEKIIDAENLTKKFGNFIAVNDVTFQVEQGEIFGFLGANGAGKTTAIKMLCGLLTPTGGKATVAGFNVFKETEKIKKNIGYMSQRFSLYEDLTVAENLEFYGGVYGLKKNIIKDKTDYFLKLLNMEEERNKLLKSLPLGWKQKLAFLTAIIHDPKIVFLDEPTGGVDPVMRRQFWTLIYKAAEDGTTVFVTTHYMDEAEYCGRISMMVDGKIAALDTPTKLKEKFNASTMHEVFVKIARG